MKKSLFSILTITMLGLFSSVNAQYCGSASTCTPQGGPSGGGFEAPNTTPCVDRGTAYNHAIQFTMFSTFDFQGHHNVDSMEFLSISNLPCGLCWTTDRATKRYAKNQDGCLTISGTTNDPAGQYKFNLLLKVWIDGQASVTIPPSLVDQSGIKLFIRVQDAGGQCTTSVDTSSSYPNNLTASASCALGIEDLNGAISAMNIAPNPMTNGAVLSFVAASNTTYNMTVSNITGQTVATKQVEVKQGANSIAIDRNSLPAGVYFVTLNDGKATITKRFSIAD